MQIQNEKDTLLCTHKACKKPQTEDGEYCEKHYPKVKGVLCYCTDAGLSVPHYTDDHSSDYCKSAHNHAHNHVDMADVCELAHKLTVRECEIKKIYKIDKTNSDGTLYTAKAQRIYDYYFETITSTLNV